MKPKEQRVTALIVIAVLVVCATIVGLSMYVRKAGIALSTLPEVLGILGISAAVVVWLIAENRRAQSVDLTDEGVWSLALRMDHGFWPRLKRELLKWEDVQSIGRRANLISLKGPKHRVAINTLLFEKPEEVAALINKSVKNTEHLRKGSQG